MIFHVPVALKFQKKKRVQCSNTYNSFTLQEVVANLERSYHDHLDFHESQQESEKWLLQISFKLMSHNSLNVSSMELTQRQIDKHRVILLSLIKKLIFLGSEFLKNSCSYDKGQNFEIYLVKSRYFTTFFITSSSMMSIKWTMSCLKKTHQT